MSRPGPRAPIVVRKYGGTSVASPDKIREVAAKCVRAKRSGCALVVVVSAMGDSTHRLSELAREAAPDPDRRELDLLLSTGELTAAALLSMAIQGLGEPAVALSGAGCGVLTDDVHTNARILAIDPRRIQRELARGRIVVAAGFQGSSQGGEVTTLGRGGSDTTAVALAAALSADRCEIYTDVDGVYSADPRVVPAARRFAEVGIEEMQELAWQGARVLKAEALELARDNGVPLAVASTFGPAGATRIRSSRAPRDRAAHLRRAGPGGVSGRTDLLRLSILPRAAGARLDQFLECIGRCDLVLGGAAPRDRTWRLYVSTEDLPDPERFAVDLARRFSEAVAVKAGLGAVSVVDFGLGSRPADLFAALRLLEGAGEIEILDSFLGRASLTFVLPARQVDGALRHLHHGLFETVPGVPAEGARRLDRTLG